MAMVEDKVMCLRRVALVAFLLALEGCSGAVEGGPAAGGSKPAGAGGTGGRATGGTMVANAGMVSQGGIQARGGTVSSGGTLAGGAGTLTGGTAAARGGETPGGASTSGGSDRQSGGTPSGGGMGGGPASGGTTQAGEAAGGYVSAGVGNSGGGTPSSGGTSGGATTSSGGASVIAGGSGPGRPKGYFFTSEWGVTSVDWHGCVWTDVDKSVSGSTTTITSPSSRDYTSAGDGGPYQLAGTVHDSDDAVAMIGFNLNKAIDGDPDQCRYIAPGTPVSGPPVVAADLSRYQGMAVKWSAARPPPTSFRIEVRGVDGATNANHRWCATITDAAGPSFVKWADFSTQCWNAGVSGVDPGAQFNPTSDPIDAVVFVVPGSTAQLTPFDFTIGGFAPGNVTDPVQVDCGKPSGTLGDATTPSQDASMQRAKVSGTDCKQYIVSNNNWGNPTGSTQTIDFVGNSLTVTTSTGIGSSTPASFPSIYIGAHGDIAGGTYSTWSDSGLPKQASAIQSIQTSFSWSGGTSGGDYNAVYEVWLAKNSPAAGSYDDGVSGVLKVWLYQPPNRQPLNSSAKRTAAIAGHNWDVWIGPRGSASSGTDEPNRPMVSYVAQDSPLSSLSLDLRDFITDAVAKGASDMSAGGTSQAFSSTWYVTDVFAGFEIWTGSSSVGLKETFRCVVK